MDESRCRSFLIDHAVDNIRHSGRTLGEHLWGTYRLLKSWGCDEAACCAGLFHSVYGTNAFGHVTIEPNSRSQVRDLIGFEAENLVYVFHCTDRPWAWFSAVRDGGTMSRISRQFIALREWDVARLIEIECANLIEQGLGKPFLTKLASALEDIDLPIVYQVKTALADSLKR